jgi:two-component system, cell cycle sensor histidine kinase and response regulator CckA
LNTFDFHTTTKTKTNPPYRVLIVDDDPAQAEMVMEFLRLAGYQELDHVASIRELWTRLEGQDYDLALLDFRLPDGTGLDVLDQMGKRGHTVPVIMVTGQGNERIAAQAIQRGAADYLLKSGDYIITLPALIHKTVQAYQLKLSVLRTQEQIRYQALLLNNVRDAVVVWDSRGEITYWSPVAETLYGWKAEERLRRPVAQFYMTTFSPAIVLPRDGELTNPYVVRRYTHRDGRVIWVSSRITALRDNDHPEELLGYMDVSHDITRRIEAEQALRESEARYRAIVEDYQTELICRFKPSGMLTFANEVFCQYFNKSRDELIGMNFLYFIPENERPRLIQHLSSFNSNRTSGTLEHQVSLPGQGLRWLQRTDRVIFDERGRIFEFQSVSRDVTERKRMESQILAAQAHLVQSARMATIGEIASGVAHQIYNPLTTIIADAQILLRNLPEGAEVRESAEAIEQAGWRLQQVIQRLMEFSRPANEAMTALNVNDTLQSALSLVHSSLESVGCQLKIELDEHIAQIRGNPNQLENLWVNLLLLARDAVNLQPATDSASTVRVVTYPGPMDTIVIEICDNGLPIPADQLATIFEPNFVGPTSGRGTGMELSICREIVRQHNGQINAESDPGHDTIFRVSFHAEV